MRFRTKHVADSVVERIQAISSGREAPAAARGASTVQMDRGINGELTVRKTFENGESEVMTISNTPTSVRNPPNPANLIRVPTDGIEEQAGIAADQGGIVENAALGGDAINALLRD